MFIFSAVPMASLLRLFIVDIALAGNVESQLPTLYNCTGGSVYFTAHPADGLLYQNPDLFHDIYARKCVTTILFTSGDRGIVGNFSRSLEQGLQAAHAFMAGVPMNETTWVKVRVPLNDYYIASSFLKETPNVQIIYLRLPDGDTDGKGFKAYSSESLRKLYKRTITSIAATDGSAKYSLESLKDVIATIIAQRSPRDVRILDSKTKIPEDNDYDGDHADHAVSARIVAEVIDENNSKGKLLAYAGSFMRKLEPTLNTTEPDFAMKNHTFFQYAKYDDHMCQTYERCLLQDKTSVSDKVPGDVKYVASWLSREYYVSEARSSSSF